MLMCALLYPFLLVILHPSHVAILEYLREGGDTFRRTSEVFMEEAGLKNDAVPAGNGLLEKKWCVMITARVDTSSILLLA